MNFKPPTNLRPSPSLSSSKPTSTNTTPYRHTSHTSWRFLVFDRYVFGGLNKYQTSVSVWMFRETNQLPRLRFSPARYFLLEGSGVRFFSTSQVQVAPKEDYEPLLFLEPVRQTRCFFCFFVGCPNNRKLGPVVSKIFLVLNPGLWGNDSIWPIFFKWA